MDGALELLQDRLKQFVNAERYIQEHEGKDDDEWLNECENAMNQLEHDLSVISAYLNSESSKLEEADSIIQRLQKLNAEQQIFVDYVQLSHVQEMLKQSAAADTTVSEHEYLQEEEEQQQENQKPPPSNAKPAAKNQIDTLSVDQLQKIPRYICSIPNPTKALTKMNDKISILNSLFNKKDMVSMQDLRNNGWQWDSNSKSLISILRHLRVLKEQRVNSVICYSLVASTTGGNDRAQGRFGRR